MLAALLETASFPETFSEDFFPEIISTMQYILYDCPYQVIHTISKPEYLIVAQT